MGEEDLESCLPKALPVADLVSNEAERDQLLQGLQEVLPGLGDALQISDDGLQLHRHQRIDCCGFS